MSPIPKRTASAPSSAGRRTRGSGVPESASRRRTVAIIARSRPAPARAARSSTTTRSACRSELSGVRDEQHRPLAPQRVDRVGHERGAHGVEVGGRLVEHDQRRRPQQRPGQGQAPALARRQRPAAVADDRVVAVGQRADEGVGTGAPGRLAHALVRRRRVGQPDVGRDRVAQEGRSLRHPRELRAPGVDAAGREIDAADGHPARRRLREAQEQGGHRALAGAALADQRDGLARRELELEALQHRAGPRRVGERHRLQPHGRRGGAGRRALAAGADLGRGVEQVQHALGDRDAVRARVELRAEAPQRQVQLGRQDQHEEGGLEADAAARQPHPDRDRDERDAEGRGELEHRPGEEAHAEGGHRGPPVLLADVGDRVRLLLAAVQGPQGREPAHDVEEVRREHAQREPALPGALLGVAPDEPHEHRHERQREQHDQRRRHVDPRRPGAGPRRGRPRPARPGAGSGRSRPRASRCPAPPRPRPRRPARRRAPPAARRTRRSTSATRSSERTSHAARRPAASKPQARRPRAAKASARTASGAVTSASEAPSNASATTCAISPACSSTRSAMPIAERRVDAQQDADRPRTADESRVERPHGSVGAGGRARARRPPPRAPRRRPGARGARGRSSPGTGGRPGSGSARSR